MRKCNRVISLILTILSLISVMTGCLSETEIGTGEGISSSETSGTETTEAGAETSGKTETSADETNQPDSDKTAEENRILEELDRTLPESEKWLAYEIAFLSDKTYENTVYTVDMDVKFTNKHTGTSFTQPAFWCGDKTWMVRVALTEIGEWSYETICTDTSNTGLHAQSGKLNCVPYTGDLDIYKHGFVKVEKGKRYFVYDDGTPFFYLGDTHWTLPIEEIDGIGDLPQEIADAYGIESQFKYIMDYRADQGYTVIQSQPLGWYTGVTGNSWFGDANGSIFDYGIDDKIVAQFYELDKRFAYIAEKGFVHANSQLAYPEELIETYLAGKISQEEIEKLCRYWVARYSAYPVMWTTTQEGDNDYYGYNGCTASNNPWIYVMTYVDKYDVYNHPTTCHQEYTGETTVNNSSFGTLEGHDWYASQFSFNLQNNSILPFSTLRQYYDNGGEKPVVNYEGKYDHFWIGTFGARAQGWVAFLNGCFGYGYGVQPIWSIVWANYGEQTPTTDGVEEYERGLNWVEGLYADAGQQLIFMKDFLTQYEWYKLVPCFSGSKYFAPSGNTNYSAAHVDSDLYIGYFFGHGKNVLGTFKNMQNGVYEVTWLNCRTGETISKEITVEDNTYTVEGKGDDGDWAIAVKYKG